jgi:hypothetical protein
MRDSLSMRLEYTFSSNKAMSAVQSQCLIHIKESRCCIASMNCVVLSGYKADA